MSECLNRQASTSITQLVKTVAKEVVHNHTSETLKNLTERVRQLETQMERHSGTHIHTPPDVEKHLSDLKNNLENRGEIWEQEEEQRLNAELELAIATIAKNHGRTCVAIASRISKKRLIQNFC